MACTRCERLETALKAAINRLYNQGGNISEITHEINMMVAKSGEEALAFGQSGIPTPTTNQGLLAEFDAMAFKLREALSR